MPPANARTEVVDPAREFLQPPYANLLPMLSEGRGEGMDHPGPGHLPQGVRRARDQNLPRAKGDVPTGDGQATPQRPRGKTKENHNVLMTHRGRRCRLP